MSSRYVLDASALLRFLDDEAGAERVEDLLNRARTASCELLMSAVNWGEVVYTLIRARGTDEGNELASRLKSLPISIVPVDSEHAEEAARFKEQFKVPYADAFAGALALRKQAVLVTADYDFKLVGAAFKIMFLPVK